MTALRVTLRRFSGRSIVSPDHGQVSSLLRWSAAVSSPVSGSEHVEEQSESRACACAANPQIAVADYSALDLRGSANGPTIELLACRASPVANPPIALRLVSEAADFCSSGELAVGHHVIELLKWCHKNLGSNAPPFATLPTASPGGLTRLLIIWTRGWACGMRIRRGAYGRNARASGHHIWL
jgi:hypothetical protein